MFFCFFEQNSLSRLVRGVRVCAWKNELVGCVPIRGTEEKKDGRAKITESQSQQRVITQVIHTMMRYLMARSHKTCSISLGKIHNSLILDFSQLQSAKFRLQKMSECQCDVYIILYHLPHRVIRSGELFPLSKISLKKTHTVQTYRRQ
jgi:hypothetical protein